LLPLRQLFCQLLLQLQNGLAVSLGDAVLPLLLLQMILQQLDAALQPCDDSLHHLDLLVLLERTLPFR